MSTSLQKGLIGELLYFNDMLAVKTTHKVLNAWVGPEGSDQDFIFDEYWAEVKAVSASADIVEISSLQQLDRSDLGFLMVFFFDKTTSTGAQTISLPEIVKGIREKLIYAHELDEFNCKLTKYGYCDKDAEKYQESRYRYAEKRCYRVDGLFPKLARANVPVSVASARYGLSLSAIEVNKVQEA